MNSETIYTNVEQVTLNQNNNNNINDDNKNNSNENKNNSIDEFLLFDQSLWVPLGYRRLRSTAASSPPLSCWAS